MTVAQDMMKCKFCWDIHPMYLDSQLHMSHYCSTILPRSFHPLPHHSPNVCADRWLWNASVAWLISRRTCKKIAFRKFPHKKRWKKHLQQTDMFFTFRKNLVFDDNDDVSRRDFILKMSSWFFFSILNRVQTKHRPNLGWFLGGHEEGGGCLAEVATPASRTLHRCLRTTSAVVGGYGRGVATARRGKRWRIGWREFFA